MSLIIDLYHPVPETYTGETAKIGNVHNHTFIAYGEVILIVILLVSNVLFYVIQDDMTIRSI